MGGHPKIGRGVFLVILVWFGVLGQVNQLCAVSLSSAVDFASVRVVSFYGSIIDTDITTLTRLLAETGTEVVFNGYYRWGPGLMPAAAAYQVLARRISEIKDTLPWIHIMGAITCSALSADEDWPNGTLVTAEARRQMLWMLPNGTAPLHYAGPFVLDISKPLARQFILEHSYALIDAGFDSLFFDEPQYVPWFGLWRHGLNIPKEPYIDSWKQIAVAVKEYAKTHHGKDLLVTINNGWVNAKNESPPPDPWPYQDFISVGISPDTLRTQTISDDWPGYKQQITRIYGHLPPIIVFLDYGGIGSTPLSLFGNLPRESQITMLKLLHQTALREGLLFAYPLHGGVFVDHKSPWGTVVYDAVSQGTYDTIRELTNSLVRVYNRTVVSTITETATREPLVAVTTDLGFGSKILVAMISVFVAGVIIGWSATRRKLSARETHSSKMMLLGASRCSVNEYHSVKTEPN